MKTLTKITMVVLFLIGISINAQASRYNFEIVSGNNQKGAVGQILGEKIKVKFTFNNKPISGKKVTFSVVSGGGRLVKTRSSTNSQGIAESKVELGYATGAQTFTARISNPVRTVTFTATSVRNVLHLHSGGVNLSRMWQKYIGQIDHADVPDIVDYSYAGYGNGNEGIPKNRNYTVHNVVDYGAIPNDGLSDTAAIRNAIGAASRGGNAIVLFPAGHYDIMMDGDDLRNFWVGAWGGRPTNNLIIKGAGGKGSNLGGTTIQMHNSLTRGTHLFRTIWMGGSGGSVQTSVLRSFPRGIKHFDVADGSLFAGKRYIKIVGHNLTGSDWDDHSSKTKAEMIPDWDIDNNPNRNISVHEFHEIERVNGNRINVVKRTLTPINQRYVIHSIRLHTGMGFEDLHIDCGFTQRYRHLVQDSNGAIVLSQTANSWIKNCRISNTTNGINVAGSYGASVMGVIIDGNGGHYPISVYGSHYTLSAMIEDFASPVTHHGASVASQVAGTVIWYVNISRGPDAHGGQPRLTLFDNYYSDNYASNGGTLSNFPNHIDMYLRWNNHVSGGINVNLWSRWSGMTSSANIGLVTRNGYAPHNSYIESYDQRVEIDSLYVAQLIHRLGYMPQWLEDAKTEYGDFFNSVYSASVGQLNDFKPVSERTQVVQDAIRSSLEHEGFNLSLHPSITPEKLLNLDSIAIVRKTFDGLNAGDFDGLDNIEDLGIEDNEMTSTSFYEGIFDNMTKLKDLWLFGNGLTTIREDAFKYNIHLRDISLANNALEDIESGTFRTLKKLDGLNLSGNKFKYLSPNTFNGLSNLTYLGLNNNKIGTFQPGSFKDLAKLEGLYIHNNNITTLPIGIFKGLKKVSILDLRGNPGSPFSVPVKLVQDPEYHRQYHVVCDYYAPFELKMKISIENGYAVTNDHHRTRTKYFTINAGEKTSNYIEVSHDNFNDRVTIDITLPKLPPRHYGYTLQKVNENQVVQSGNGSKAPRIQVPTKTLVLASYPNPFNPETWIPYQLAKSSKVSITIYDSRGTVIRELAFGMKAAGHYMNRSRAAHWDGRNATGERVSSGMYFYQFKTDSLSVLRKMVIMK